jgi:polyhydroxyalkanoate synthase subunit PhaC
VDTNRSPTPARAGLPAAFAEPQRLLRNLLSVPRVVQTALRTRVGTTPRAVVLEAGTHTLLHYTRETPATQAEPVLLCYALVNRPYILDLQPDKSVVRRYLERGFEVYMIDWGVPSDADRGLTLEHYVCGFLARAVDFIRRRHDRAQVHLLGYCMGGTLSALYGALQPDALATLALLAAPIDFAGREALLNLWTADGAFDVDALVDAHGNCPAWFLQSCFLFMNPVRNIADKAIAFWEQMSDGRAMSSHFALERWLNDNIPVAGETFRQFVKNLYQRNELVRGELRVGDRHVDLARITCPLLLLTAKNDHLVAPASTEGIRRHVGSRDVTSMGMSAGHVGLVVGGKAHATFWPEVTRWTAERSSPAFANQAAANQAAANQAAANQAPAPRASAPAPAEPRPTPVRKIPTRRDEYEPRWWASR